VIAVVVPVLNEARALPAILDCVLAQAPCEVVVVDGGSDDGTLDVAAQYAGVRIMSAPRGRARQMNAGVAASTGDPILFLHADTLLPHGALTAIASAAREPGFIYGGFHHRFSGPGWRLRMISLLHNLRCHITRIFYGDQAMFVSRYAFDAAGGFPDGPVEDIAICERLRQLGRPAFLPLRVVTSSRKFEAMGIWRSFARVLAILVCLRIGRRLPAAFFADIR